MTVIPASFSRQVRYYADWYYEFGADTWNQMTPMQYGTLLISIGVFGWILMKTSFNK